MKSPFWTYFHDKLNWLPIFRPGPVSALMRGLALHMDEVRQDILWLREQWNPATCEMWLLERYGASRGIFRTRFDTNESYRKRVIYAHVWHKLGGKVRGLERIYLENGLLAQVSSSPFKDLWAHFRVYIDVNSDLFGPETAEMSFWIANEYKAARSVLEGIWTYSSLCIHNIIGIGNIGATESLIYLYFAPPKPTYAERFLAAAVFGVIRDKINFYHNIPQVPGATKYHGVAINSFTSSKTDFYTEKYSGLINRSFIQLGLTTTYINYYGGITHA